MTSDPIVELDELEVDPVTNWRFDALIEVGYTNLEAAAIAVKREIDLHFAVEMVTMKGCKPSVAASILL